MGRDLQLPKDTGEAAGDLGVERPGRDRAPERGHAPDRGLPGGPGRDLGMRGDPLLHPRIRLHFGRGNVPGLALCLHYHQCPQMKGTTMKVPPEGSQDHLLRSEPRMEIVYHRKTFASRLATSCIPAAILTGMANETAKETVKENERTGKEAPKEDRVGSTLEAQLEVHLQDATTNRLRQPPGTTMTGTCHRREGNGEKDRRHRPAPTLTTAIVGTMNGIAARQRPLLHPLNQSPPGDPSVSHLRRHRGTVLHLLLLLPRRSRAG